ncbi:OmpH family outer membrane protein [Porphyromonadaceae bacterium W3.11]|nr:OmpH family outer membrane protein [Porphyromonadaceae bacterium W3.11]
MKRILLLIVTAMMSVGALVAQEANYALIDMQYLMGQIPQYKSATEQIEKQSDKWSNEIKKLQDQAKDLYIQYQKDLPTMNSSDRVKRENAIVKVEDQAAQLQQKYFGRDGELMKLQSKLIKPLQDKIYEAVKLISQRRGYLIVFDRASSVGSIIYADPAADISNEVLAVLGYSN